MNYRGYGQATPAQQATLLTAGFELMGATALGLAVGGLIGEHYDHPWIGIVGGGVLAFFGAGLFLATPDVTQAAQAQQASAASGYGGALGNVPLHWACFHNPNGTRTCYPYTDPG